jgi:threonine dehydratase
LFQKLRELDYPVIDLTDNEMAKMHIRYMVGGRSDLVSDERLFRFEFPERPGALLRFLNRLGDRWNISLFHYRNHGAAYGRVLAGIQVPAKDNDALKQFLADVGYVHCEETENPAYRLFLK